MCSDESAQEPYGAVHTPEASAARQELEPEVQLAVLGIIDKICADPLRESKRVRSISRDGKIRVYRHRAPPLEITFEVDEGKRRVFFMHYVATSVNVRKKVFVSYSHEDREWLDRLKKWLGGLEKVGGIEMWDDSLIAPGSDWRKEIREALSSAKVALLLVSQNFLSSKFIPSEELAPILESAHADGVEILWVAVSEALYEETGIAQYQALNDPNKPLDSLEEADLNRQLKEIYYKIKDVATN